MNFILWLLIAAAGVASIYYSDELVKFGTIMRAENNLWGTRQLYVLVWFVILVLGMMVMFWLADLSGDTSTIQINQ
jgi:hypothetical protein